MKFEHFNPITHSYQSTLKNKGTNEWVHLECLRKWQKSVLLNQSTHPKYQTSIDRICNVCLEPFQGIGVAPSRHEQIVKYTGAQIVSLVKRGNLLVSTRESSRENLDLMRKHPEIAKRLEHWTRAVFLMISAHNGMIALGTTLKLNLSSVPRRMRSCDAFTVTHYDSGPVEPNRMLAVTNMLNLDFCTEEDLDRVSLQRIEPGILLGSFDDVATLAQIRYRKTGVQSKINVCHGLAGWGKTQILAEIARGGWGIVTVSDFISSRPDPTMDVDWDLDYDWSRLVGLAKCAPKTEYTRRGR